MLFSYTKSFKKSARLLQLTVFLLIKLLAKLFASPGSLIFFEAQHSSFIQFVFQNYLHSVLEQLKLQEKQKDEQVRSVLSNQPENF